MVNCIIWKRILSRVKPRYAALPTSGLSRVCRQETCAVSSPFRAAPRCYLARESELVLEDLCARGFVMADRKAGLDAQHCRAAMRELALLHALSLAMKLRRPQEFATRVAACVQEALFVPENEDWYRGYYRAATRNALTVVSMLLCAEYCLNPFLLNLLFQLIRPYRIKKYLKAFARLLSSVCNRS